MVSVSVRKREEVVVEIVEVVTAERTVVKSVLVEV